MGKVAWHLPPVLLLLLLTVSCRERPTDKLDTVARPGGGCRVKEAYIPSTEPFLLRIPAIGLEAEVGPAPVVGGRLDHSRLKRQPILVSPAARESLREIGRPGVGLILGHRQWGLRPLVFARLDKLGRGDLVIAQSATHTVSFTVYRRTEIPPELIWQYVDGESAANVARDVSGLVLVSCAPYGYNYRRILVFARQKKTSAPSAQSGGSYSRP